MDELRSRLLATSLLDSGVESGAAALDLPVPVDRRQPVLVPGAGLLACFDSLAAVVSLLAVLISVSLPNVSKLDDFLSARITVKNVLLLILLATAWPIMFQQFGLYEARRLQHFGSEVRRLIGATTAGSLLALAFPLTSVSGGLAVRDLRLFWVVAFGLCFLIRTGRRAVERARNPHVRRTLIVGTGPLAYRVFRHLSVGRSARREVVGFLDELGGPEFPALQPMIGTLMQLEQILMREVIDEVIIALPVKSRYREIQDVIGVCESMGVRAKYGVDLFTSTVAFPRFDAHDDAPFVAMQVAPEGYRLVVKRAIDILGATVGLVIFAPLMLVLAAAIKLTSAGPAIYAQDRCGFHRRPLRMYKFRTMSDDADQLQHLLEHRNEATGAVFKIHDDPRITVIGRLLRKLSLDELPQLWNILRGDMSLVGPRPLPWRDVQRITRPSDMRRFSMRPGLTCLWQIQGRCNLSFETWVELDLRYIDTWSLRQDLAILVKTIPAVLTGNGAV
jgi:exopolysaccharide biosynthesis polyprenyl glycosylphosphotransferase